MISISNTMRPWNCWVRTLVALTLLLVFSEASLYAQNQILVERSQVLPITEFSPKFLQTQAYSQFGLAEVSAEQMHVTRGQPALWRVRMRGLASSAPPTSLLLAINNSFDRDVVLYFPPLYLPEKHNLYDTSTPTEHSRFTLAIHLPDALMVGDVFFIAMPQPTAAALDVAVMDRVSYARRDLNLVRLHSAIISMLLASCAVALCFFLILKERIWLFFIAYVLAVIGYVLTRTGELMAIIDTAAFDSFVWQAATVLPFFGSALHTFFLIEFVRLKETTPKTAKALQGYAWIMLVLGFGSLFPNIAKSNALSAIGNTLLFICVVLTLYANVASVRLGSRSAVFFLIAYFPQQIIAVLMILQMRGMLSGGVWANVLFLSSYAFSSIVLSLGMADQVLGYRKQRDAAIHEAERDPLTGAFNRRAANQALARAIKRLDTAHDSLAICFFDLDFFKKVNDRFGHAVGDVALRLLAAQAQLELRSSDFLARLGGEEFIAVLPGAYLRDGLAIAERIRARVEKQGQIIAGQPVNLTVSVGVMASNAKLNSADALIDAADQALYLAKSRGRNRVETMDLVNLANLKKEKAT